MDVVCRLCGNTKHRNEIKCTIKNKTFQIEQKLIDCCRWKSNCDEKNFPKHVCMTCFNTLEMCWQFSETVAATQRKLADSFKNVNIPTATTEEPISITVDGGIDIKEEFLNCENSLDGLEMDDFNEWFDDNSIQSLSNLSSEIKSEPLSDAKLQPIVLLEVLKQPTVKDDTKPQKVNNELDADIDETLESYTKFEINFPACLSEEDKNVDGTVKEEAIERLKIANWSVYQHKCNECGLSFINNVDLGRHYRGAHAHMSLRHRCWICPSNYGKRSILAKHIVRQHIPHLAYWFVY